jgi:hypothetical protein
MRILYGVFMGFLFWTVSVGLSLLSTGVLVSDWPFLVAFVIIGVFGEFLREANEKDGRSV